VYKYGNESIDDQSFIGCLMLISDRAGRQLRDDVDIRNFGQIEPRNPIQQSTIEAHYDLDYTE